MRELMDCFIFNGVPFEYQATEIYRMRVDLTDHLDLGPTLFAKANKPHWLGFYKYKMKLDPLLSSLTWTHNIP